MEDVEIDHAHQRRGRAAPLGEGGVVVDEQRALFDPVEEHARLEHAADFRDNPQVISGRLIRPIENSDYLPNNGIKPCQPWFKYY